MLLQDEIRRRRQDFVTQEREIEALAAEAEEKERRGGRGVSVGGDAQHQSSEVSEAGNKQVIPERQVERESASHDTGKSCTTFSSDPPSITRISTSHASKSQTTQCSVNNLFQGTRAITIFRN